MVLNLIDTVLASIRYLAVATGAAVLAARYVKRHWVKSRTRRTGQRQLSLASLRKYSSTSSR